MKRLLDLSSRMAVCDANYLRLRKLLPDFSMGQSRCVLLPAFASQRTGATHRLLLCVTESFRYTSTVALTVELDEPAPAWFRSPRLQVRLYHDAGTAEVTGYQDKTQFKAVYSEDDLPRFNGDEKNQLNLFLADWLILCLESGLGESLLPDCLGSASYRDG
ncbi:MAG: hypothetical protein RLZZ169_1247 [Pseudomonadota bacterium]|jgi:uncharacterized protein YqiB (DUF1249 family)